MKKKILSFLTMLCMVVALLPTNIVFAETTSGTCGDNLTWTLDDNGTLTISGTGVMDYYEEYSDVPWKTYCTNIKKIYIQNGITSIGGRAFGGCSNLTHITIPNGVSYIGEYAFTSCINLKNIELPDTLEYIFKYAFNNCSNLNNIELPNKLKEIREYAFRECKSLTTISIPENVKLSFYVFQDCTSLSNITLPENLTYIDSYWFGDCKGLTNIVLPDNITEIKSFAFQNCSNLKELIIPNTVTYIGNCAFRNCSSLTSVTIPKSIKSINPCTFQGCNNLKNVYYNGTESEWNKIKVDNYNTSLTDASRTYFAYINISDKDGNKVIDTTQNMGETVDTSSIKVPEGYKLVLCKDKEMTEEYSLDTPISENLNLYYDIIEVNKLKITGTESADIGQKGITESVTFATDKTAKDFVATIKYSDKLNFVKANSEIFDIEADEYTDDEQKYLSLTCTYKNDGNMPINTTLNAFDLVFDVSESATANEKLTIEFVGGETFLADSGANTYDFDGLGTAEIKVNRILVKSVTINGADEIDKATQYTAVISPENATNKDIEWTVDNIEIATISADGTLTPVKAGTVKITATAKDGSGISGEKSVNVKVYAEITALSASSGVWDKEFTPAEREYIIYVPENTSSIKFTAQHSGTLKSETKTFYNGRLQTISLTDTETVLTLTYSQTGYTDSKYKIKIVKFEGTKTTVSEDGKTFTIKPINIASGNTIILALYNGEEFVTMQSAVYSGKDIPFTVTDDYTTARVMVWNNLDDITPICDVEIAK